MKYYLVLSLLALTTVTGCSTFQKKVDEHKGRMIKCYPEDSYMCIGWLGNKPIDLEEL